MQFTDTKGRTIVIDADLDIEARHEGRRIGCIEFDECDGFISLFAMNVDLEFQKAGIGTAMMKVAADVHGRRFGKPSLNAVGGRHASSDSYYTQEGAALIARCLREKILDNTEPSEFDEYVD
jgi:GNAT superfamily N-acetyltransferase